MKIWIAILPIIFGISFGQAFGHGFGSETLPPVTIGNRNASLTITVNPPTFDPKDIEHEIVVNLSDSKSSAVIEHVTYLIELSKDDSRIFRYMFHDELGNLYMKIRTVDSEKIKVYGKKDNVLKAWMKKDDSNPLVLEGPIFTTGGLYKFHIEIVTVDSDTKLLDERVMLNAAISLGEKTFYDVNLANGQRNQLGITSYYDIIGNFKFIPENYSVTFTMPFDWSKENIEQPNLVVHEELHIPKTFGEMLVTKYETTVNGVPLPDNAVIIDDYSDENRNVHVVLNKQELLSIYDVASKDPKQMKFTISPSKEVKFPLSANTPDLMYQVDLSWEPPKITSDKTTRFFVDLNELFTDKKPKPAMFDFVLKQNDAEIFRETISGQTNVLKSNFVDYTFKQENLGPVIVLIEKVNGNSFSNASFVAVVNPAEMPKQVFPIRLTSVKSDQSGNLVDGKYYIDLTWVPEKLGIGEESEFILTMYDKITGLPVPQAEYDFVFLQNNNEVYRKSGFAQAGGSFENYKFLENQVGQITIRIDNIDDSGEFAEIPISVTPEFPFGSLIVLIVIFAMTIIISKLRFLPHAY
ncbi:MAG: peptidase [Nitrosopumilaceae archaeon]